LTWATVDLGPATGAPDRGWTGVGRGTKIARHKQSPPANPPHRPLKSALPNLLFLLAPLTAAQEQSQPRVIGVGDDPFRQLEELLPTPNTYRNASGAPGVGYWQQRADHEIRVSLEEDTRRITGWERIHYHNNSPDELRFLWVQLDNNIFAPESDAVMIGEAPSPESGRSFGHSDYRRLLAREEFEGGIEVLGVRDANGAPLAHTIVGTMMRLDLPQPLGSQAATSFEIEWTYVINRDDEVGGRTAAEYFEEDDNWIFELAHWFPRMCVYSDVEGWHNKQFLGSGEFTLEFGDYRVEITVPADHVVAATGELQNPEAVLTPTQRERLARARGAERPVLVITPEEAAANQAERAEGTRTWIFEASDVRDFAWASSRKFAWDAMTTEVEGRQVLCMSYFPNEGEPLWSRYSTHAVAHTVDVYSKFTVPYPYPVAISVNGPVGGMEYPMICFNGPRPEPDGTYSERTKYGLIGVIIHEVGHNWFPMIINSDERQWTWMDEGLNTFVQYLAEQEWEPGYPSRRGEPRNITAYMTSTDQVPIMTNSESILQFGNNAYAKPATALNILRETVLGRELFDFAFAEYSRRWAFKRPMPADLFRTLEDASAVDLDWFWYGWFFTTRHVDLAIERVERLSLDKGDPTVTKARDRAQEESLPETLGERRNAPLPKRSDRFPELLDFYNDYDRHAVTPKDERDFAAMLEDLEPWERALVERDDPWMYLVTLRNDGGIPMPVVLELQYADGRTEELRIPAELWRRGGERVTKLLMTDAELTSLVLDPHDEIADADRDDNHFPPRMGETRFELFKRKQSKNPMQLERAEAEREADEGAQDAPADDPR
jgi:hypothetical protein